MKTESLPRMILLALTLMVTTRAAEPSVEERLKALENEVHNLARENAELKKELGWKENKAPVLAQPVGKEVRLSIGGFLQAQAEFGQAADSRWTGVKDRFFFRRARIYVTGSFAENLDFKAELDLQGNSLSAGTGLLARANEIYINWRKYDFATVRFGQIKSAFGAEQLANDTRLFAIERTLPNDRLTDGRQIGLSLGGDFANKKVGYLFVVANGNGVNVSANDNGSFQKSARVYYTPIATKETKVTLGVDGLWTHDSSVTKSGFGFAGNLFTGERSAWGVDLTLNHGPWDVSAEWLHNTFEPAPGLGSKFSAEGWQLTAAYFVISTKVQALLRHEEFDPNTAIGANTTRSWTFGLNYLIKGEDLRLMVDYIHGDVPGSVVDGGRLLTRMQVLF